MIGSVPIQLSNFRQNFVSILLTWLTDPIRDEDLDGLARLKADANGAPGVKIVVERKCIVAFIVGILEAESARYIVKQCDNTILVCA